MSVTPSGFVPAPSAGEFDRALDLIDDFVSALIVDMAVADDMAGKTDGQHNLAVMAALTIGPLISLLSQARGGQALCSADKRRIKHAAETASGMLGVH